MSDLPTYVHASIAALCPILGVSLPTLDDKTTWRVDYDPVASDAQRQAAAAWLAAFDPATWTPVPGSVSRYQALAALSNAGLLAQAQAAVNASTNPLVPLAWNNAQAFERNSQFIAALAPALNLTSAQVDGLFIAAEKITA